jgi:hypothetical protein
VFLWRSGERSRDQAHFHGCNDEGKVEEVQPRNGRKRHPLPAVSEDIAVARSASADAAGGVLKDATRTLPARG